jgi:hypothetical protein
MHTRRASLRAEQVARGRILVDTRRRSWPRARAGRPRRTEARGRETVRA